MADTARDKDFATAAKIKATKTTGIGPGWSFPKEDQLKAKWEKWNQQFAVQSQDLLGLFNDHFETSKRELEEEAAKQLQL